MAMIHISKHLVTVIIKLNEQDIILDICCKDGQNNNTLESNKLITHRRNIIIRYNYYALRGACAKDFADIVLMTRVHHSHQIITRINYD